MCAHIHLSPVYFIATSTYMRYKLIAWPCGCCVVIRLLQSERFWLSGYLQKASLSYSHLVSWTTVLVQPSASAEHFVFLFVVPPGQPHRHRPYSFHPAWRAKVDRNAFFRFSQQAPKSLWAFKVCGVQFALFNFVSAITAAWLFFAW